jgi:metal-responsive CopG/Arc/MetJ family transcriptional regulator
MKTIQMTIDEPLLEEVDELIQSLEITRSAFIREALQRALQQYKIKQLERQHVAGYVRQPVEADEFEVWTAEQVWSEE